MAGAAQGYSDYFKRKSASDNDEDDMPVAGTPNVIAKKKATDNGSKTSARATALQKKLGQIRQGNK